MGPNNLPANHAHHRGDDIFYVRPVTLDDLADYFDRTAYLHQWPHVDPEPDNRSFAQQLVDDQRARHAERVHRVVPDGS